MNLSWLLRIWLMVILMNKQCGWNKVFMMKISGEAFWITTKDCLWLTLLPRILMLSFPIISQNKLDEFGTKVERREKQKLRCQRLLFRTASRPCLKAISLKIVNKKGPGWILLFCRVSIRRQTTQKLSDNDLAGEPVVYKNIMKEKIALLLSRSKRKRSDFGLYIK